jgi:hypothetical protein
MRGLVRGLPVLLGALALVAIGPLTSDAYAQYFGQNKVQYKDLHFKVLKTDHFDVYFYPEEHDAAVQAARMAERWYARYVVLFKHKLSTRQPLILYASHADFEQTNAIQGFLGEGTGGVTEPVKRRIVLPLGASLAETNHVIGHELVHAFQFDMTSGGGKNAEAPGAARLPLWFIEGMAEYLSLGPDDPNTAMWIRDAAGQEKLPDIDKLDDPKYFPYRWGQAFWAYVAGRWGDQTIRELLLRASANGGVDAAIKHVLKISTKDLSKDWHRAIYDEYGPVQKATHRAQAYGRLLISGKEPGGDVNVTPSISPDGRRVLFFSERDLFSIDLYLADAETGKVLHRVVNTALDPHFSSLEFIDSAGAWAPDGRRIVFAAVHQGRPELVLLDIETMKIEREIPFTHLDSIINPAWSPDGRKIAFSATVGGLSDLFVYDLERKKLKRLTDDPFTDLQPAWSPDGRQIVFVTDRYSTTLDDLSVGNYRLALADASTGVIESLPSFEHGKNIDPQWSPDGKSIYFLSDHSGITDVYRYDVATRERTQVTNLFTGVSGITALSPALSVAEQAGHVVMSVYEHGKYDIYALDGRTTLEGAAPTPVEQPSPALLPPVDRTHEELLALYDQPSRGLPASSKTGTVGPYRSHLSLDAVGRPSIGAGVDPFGTYIGGGLSFLWSDMLGNHELAAGVQTGSYFGTGFSDILNNTAGALQYQNLSHRWHWGGAIDQYPYLAGGFTNDTLVNDNGYATIQQQTTLYRQINRGASALASYPLDQDRRVEFSAGLQHVTFDQVQQTQLYDYSSGALLNSTTKTVPSGNSLNLAQTSAAYVFDNSIFGATSPIDGQRYRLELTPTFGSIGFTDVLADYRRYFMPVKLYTIAARVVHFGRYGSGSEDPRLVPLFIGYPELVRGYDIGSFSPSECAPTATDPCPAFDRLIGSRALVANLEFRFPLLRPFGISDHVYGPVPVEVALFTDAGVAWDAGQRPSFLGGTRKAVESAGVAFRVNAFGYAVLQFDIAHPFQRPGQGWMFQFSVSPGF